MDFDPNDIPKFEIPEKIFDKIYEFSSAHESSRGILIAYLADNGQPLVYSRYGSKVVEFGLRKAMEMYLEELEAVSTIHGVDFGDEDGLEEL